MSTLENNLYKRISIDQKTNSAPPVSSRTYRGLSTINPNNTSFTLYDFALIKQDIINHFHIRKGEKLENPNFGTIIWLVLYDPLTESIKELIINDVTEIINYDPRVAVDEVFVDSYENGIQINCTLRYLPYNISETLKFNFDKDIGLTS